MINKLGYYICLFLYSLKDKKVSKNTLFRYVYIFDVVNDDIINAKDFAKIHHLSKYGW